MKHGSTGRRSRNNRGGTRQGANSKTRVYDSNGPDVRIRGTAHQIAEKYINLAKDAGSAGDHVLSESYMQHAEHYQRIVDGWVDLIDDVIREDIQIRQGHMRDDDLHGPGHRSHGSGRRTRQKPSSETSQNEPNGNLKEVGFLSKPSTPEQTPSSDLAEV